MTVSFLGYTAREEKSAKRNSELGSLTSQPRVLSSLSPVSLAVCCRQRSSIILSLSLNLTFRFHHSLLLRATPLILSLLPLLFPLSTFHGHMGRKLVAAEKYNRITEENDWMLGAHKEGDNRQQTKKELGKDIKNQQEA